MNAKSCAKGCAKCAPNIEKDLEKVGFSVLFKANTYSKGRISMHRLRRYEGCSVNPTYFLHCRFNPTISHTIRRLSAGKATRRRRQGEKQGRNVAQLCLDASKHSRNVARAGFDASRCSRNTPPPRFDTLKHGGGSLSWKISPSSAIFFAFWHEFDGQTRSDG